MNQKQIYRLGIDIGSTTVKIAILNNEHEVLFSDYERHFANIQETLSDLLSRAIHKLGLYLLLLRSSPIRRTYISQTLRCSFCTRGHRSISRSAGLCSSDRCCYRAWRGRC